MDPTEFSVTVLPLAVTSPPSVIAPDKLVASVKLPAELIVPDVVNDRTLVKLSNPELALVKGPKMPTIFGPVRLAPPTELPVSVAAVISPPVWLIVPVGVRVTVVPAVRFAVSARLPDTVSPSAP